MVNEIDKHIREETPVIMAFVRLTYLSIAKNETTRLSAMHQHRRRPVALATR